MRNAITLIWLILVILWVGGCASKKDSTLDYFLREDVDIGFVQRIAILPFENNSDDVFAAKRSREIAITEVLSGGLFDTVDKGIVDSVFLEEAIVPGSPIDTISLKQLGQRMNVQALMLGSVDSAGRGGRGAVSFDEITMTLRLVESRSGIILWQASGHETGDSLLLRLFGMNAVDNYVVTSRLMKRLLATIPRGE